MNDIKIKIVVWLKKKLDKIYYNQYTLSRETLIREMFPWINRVWEYDHLETFMRNTSVSQLLDLITVIYSYYWGEVNALISVWKIDEINKLKWLLDFANAIRDYKDRVMSEETI